MASQKSTQDLLEKYWAAETTTEEERQLHAAFAQEEKGVYAAYFQMLQDDAVKTMSAPVSSVRQAKQIRMKRALSIAAAVLILVMAGLFVQQSMVTQVQQANADSYEDPMEAYEEAKEALLLVSAKLKSTREMAGDQLAKTQPYIEIIK